MAIIKITETGLLNNIQKRADKKEERKNILVKKDKKKGK